MRIIPILLTGVLLSSCSGGSGGGTTALPHTAAPSNGAPQSAARSTVTFTISPSKQTPAATKRGAQYISPSMQSLVVTLTAQGGTAVSSPQPYAVNMTSCPTVNGTPTCSVTLPAAIGTDTFTVATYDAAQSSTTPATLTGNVLSTASTTVTVPSGANTVVPLTLNGVVASVSIALATAAPPTGTAATIPLNVTAKDADGNVIVGPGSYSSPITLTDSDTTGVTTLSTTTVTSPSTSVTVTYSGGGVSASFSASAPNVATATTMLTPTPQSIIVAEFANTVQVLQATAPFTPKFAITTGLDDPSGVATDRNGNIYVANFSNNTVTEYSSSGSLIKTLSSGLLNDPAGVTVDSSGKIYVANSGPSPSQVLIFAATATGTDAPIQTINLPSSGLHNAWSIAFDAAGNIYVTDVYSSVFVYSPSGTLLNTIPVGSNYVYGLAIDASGKIYITNYEGNGGLGSVATYTSSGAATTPTILSNINAPDGICLDLTGKIYVANYTGNSVTIFGSDGTFLSTVSGLPGATSVAVF